MPLTYEVARDELLVTIRGDYETTDEWRAMLAAVPNARVQQRLDRLKGK